MGFFRRLFRTKNPPPSQTSPTSNNRKKWSFARSSRPSLSQPNSHHPYGDNLDPSKHAIAVAAATAAVAEAALAAAQAAAEVVRLTGGAGRCVSLPHIGQSHRRLTVDVAVVKIQSAFRAYLARRALRALKALVKLQALVRGHFVRKRTADMLRRMQTLERVQARVRATRSNLSNSPGTHTKSHLLPSNSHYKVFATTSHKDRLRASGGKLDSSPILKRCGSSSDFRNVDPNRTKIGCNWLDRWMEESLQDYHDITSQRLRNWYTTAEKNDKILEVDTWKPHTKSQQSDRTFLSQQDSLNLNQLNHCPVAYDTPAKLPKDRHKHMPKVSSQQCSQPRATKMPPQKDNVIFTAAESNPHMLSSSPVPGNSWRKDPSSPSRSESRWGFLNGYASYPNYMVNTESSRAKFRSQSVPRQRVEFEQFGTGKRYSQRSCDTDASSERGFVRHTNFRGTAYPAPIGSFNRIGSVNLR